MSPALLVSVRSRAEAVKALRGGVDVIDVKNPSEGPLGRPTASIVADVVAAIEPATPLSIALGELQDFVDHSRIVAAKLRESIPDRRTWAKLGLAGCSENPRWTRLWAKAIAALPGHVSPVAVAYADYDFSRAPRPEDVIGLGAELGCHAFLIDTQGKDGRGLFDHLPFDRVRDLVDAAREAGLRVALAGSLDLATIPQAVACDPDWIAVRGAACNEGRESHVAAERVRGLVEAIGVARRN